jgi:hypothetical protein
MLKSGLWRGAALVTASCGLIGAGAGAAAAAVAAPAAATVTIGTKSALKPVDGHTLVVFLGTGKTNAARVSGTVTGAAAGDQVTLLAKRFGAARYSATGGAITLTSATASYSFTVRPGLATSYEAQVTGSGTVVGTSPARTVYVEAHGAITGKTRCSRPVCHIKLRVWVKVPTSAYATEAAKHWYLYSRLFLSAHGKPASPKVLKLNHRATASRPTRLHTYEFVVTVRYAFRIGRDAYSWNVGFCTKDSERNDGLGLPGQHGCGNKWISANPAYLG